jgi:hypothetical protein
MPILSDSNKQQLRERFERDLKLNSKPTNREAAAHPRCSEYC